MSKRLSGMSLAALFFMPGVASALSVTAQFIDVDPREAVRVYLDDADADASANVSLNVWAGEMDWWVNGTESQSTFCIELVQTINFGQTVTYTSGDLGAAVGGGVVPNPVASPYSFALTSNHVDLLEQFWDYYIGDVAAATGAQGNLLAAAFQLGIWEIVYDGATGMNTSTTTGGNGTFWAENKAPWQQTVAWLNDGNFIQHTGRTNLFVWTNPTAQDQIFAATPTPAAALPALACMGVLGLGYRPRRSRSID